LEIIQNNIGIANDYRMELRKQLLTIATAIFAFTVSLFPQHQAAGSIQASPTLAWSGWTLLLVSIICGLSSLNCWERFYMSFRDYDNKGEEAQGVLVRKGLTFTRRVVDTVQIVTLAGGAVLVAIFAASRLGG
jgi:uncharacterized membrane protein YcjF (UPF0283 family)